jgi:hypothetical protein
VLTLSDFNAGSPLTLISYSGQDALTVDATALVNALAILGGGVAGFNFRFTIPSSILWNGPFVAFNSSEYPPSATMAITPAAPIAEPAYLLLLSRGL